jgi:hypothetical protein
MRITSLCLVLAAGVAAAVAQTSTTASPRGKNFPQNGMVYITKEGRVLNMDEMRAAMRMGVPIHIQFTRQGKKMIVERVVVDND